MQVLKRSLNMLNLNGPQSGKPTLAPTATQAKNFAASPEAPPCAPMKITLPPSHSDHVSGTSVFPSSLIKACPPTH